MDTVTVVLGIWNTEYRPFLIQITEILSKKWQIPGYRLPPYRTPLSRKLFQLSFFIFLALLWHLNILVEFSHKHTKTCAKGLKKFSYFIFMLVTPLNLPFHRHSHFFYGGEVRHIARAFIRTILFWCKESIESPFEIYGIAWYYIINC